MSFHPVSPFEVAAVVVGVPVGTIGTAAITWGGVAPTVSAAITGGGGLALLIASFWIDSPALRYGARALGASALVTTASLRWTV